jgi:AcrR family transcriptional regulator
LSTPDHDLDTPAGAVDAPAVAAAPAERRMRADARRNRERILVAAGEAFAAYGSDAQMDDVARAAGVGVGTVYRHFPTKEALQADLVRRKFEIFAANAREALEAGGDPWEAFAGLLRRNAEIMARDVAVQQAMAGSVAAWTMAAEARAELYALGAQLVERAQRSGQLRADFTVDDIPLIMCGVSSTMAAGDFDWRRHLELSLDGLRTR